MGAQDHKMAAKSFHLFSYICCSPGSFGQVQLFGWIELSMDLVLGFSWFPLGRMGIQKSQISGWFRS